MLRKGASWHWIRVVLVLGLAAPMLASMEYGISQLAAGLNQELYYSARLEETSKLDMEATRLFDAADLYVTLGGADLLKAVNTKLDLVWSRVETAKTKSYQTVLEDDKQDISLVPELYDALPSFDAAVKDLRPGDRSSLSATRRLETAIWAAPQQARRVGLGLASEARGRSGRAQSRDRRAGALHPDGICRDVGARRCSSCSSSSGRRGA